MSKYYTLRELPPNKPMTGSLGKARRNQPIDDLDNNFDQGVLYYLSESVINHLADSITLANVWSKSQVTGRFNDLSFFTAPAYKAFEGFLFQIANDLNLPSSGDPKFVGTFFDEEKVDKTIDKLIKELEAKTEKETKLKKEEKIHIKDMIKEMKRFLVHYRHTPAHFHGESIDTIEKAQQNIFSMYRIINETVKTLSKANLLQVKDGLH